MLKSDFENSTLKSIFYYLEGLWYIFLEMISDQAIQCFMNFL